MNLQGITGLVTGGAYGLGRVTAEMLVKQGASVVIVGLPPDIRAALAKDVPHPHRLRPPLEYAALVRCIIQNPMLNGETIQLDGAVRVPAR